MSVQKLQCELEFAEAMQDLLIYGSSESRARLAKALDAWTRCLRRIDMDSDAECRRRLAQESPPPRDPWDDIGAAAEDLR